MIELEFRNVDFCGGRKTGEPGEKPSKLGRESTTQLTCDTEYGNRYNGESKSKVLLFFVH
jgi:hypothetical protein